MSELCAVCGDNHPLKPLSYFADIYHTTGGVFENEWDNENNLTLMWCPNCGLVYAKPKTSNRSDDE